jgi:hypothetical protein
VLAFPEKEVDMAEALRIATRLWSGAETMALMVFPHGGQRAARTNAARAVENDVVAEKVRRHVQSALDDLERSAYAEAL